MAVMGGAIQPVKIVTNEEVDAGEYRIGGRMAQPVHGFVSAGRAVRGGPVEPVYVVTQAQVDSGDFVVQGGAAVPVGNVAIIGGAGRAVNGRVARPVYVVGGTLSSGGDNFDPEAAALFAAMSPAPDNARKALINAWFVGIKADFGVASIALIFDIFYMLAAHSAQAAHLNWVNPATFTLIPAVNPPAFEVDRGYTGNGSSSYIDTTWNLSTNSTVYTQNSATLGVYCRTNTNSGQDAAVAAGSFVEARASNLCRGRNNTNSTPVSVAMATSEGMTAVSRTASNLTTLYKNGVSQASNTVLSTPPVNLPLFCLANNNSGTANQFTTRQTCVLFAARGMNSTENAALFNRTEAFLDAIGAGVVA